MALIDDLILNITNLRSTVGVKLNALWDTKYTLPSGGTANQYINGLGNLVAFPTIPSITNLVPYTGATANVNLGTRSITSTGGFIGNASTATTLATARTINGTSFNGSANITTALWGTSRNITIGNTTKAVNGSANVSWSLAEIGVPTTSDYITTNTNQTGLSGNKITSGVWSFISESTAPLRIENTNTENVSIRYGLNNYFWYAGLANKDIYAIGTSSGLSSISNRLFWIDNTGLVSSKSGFNKYGQNDTQMLLAGGGHRPVSDFALASWGRGLRVDGNSIAINNATQSSTSVFTVKNASMWATTSALDKFLNTNSAIVNFSALPGYGFTLAARNGRIGFSTEENTVNSSWLELYHTGNFNPSDYALVSQLSDYVPTTRVITAGNGLSGGGSLAANRTFTLGTPSAITLSSTNSVTTSSHTHAFTPGGTTAQYIRGDGSLATMPTFTDAITSVSRNGVNIPIVSQNVDIPIFSTSGAGLVPARVGSVATKYLREDGTWVTPTNTTYSAGTLELLQAGTNATNRVWSAQVLAQRFYQFQSIMAYINTDTDNIDSNVTWGTNIITGSRNQIQGARNIVKGEDINIFGSRNMSSGINNQINGFANVANGAFNTINGAYSSINGSQANTIGNYLFARDNQTVLGMYNKVYDVGDDEGLRVVFGTGNNDLDKFNAVEIYDDHRTEFHGKAAYDEETRNPEWFTQDYTHVDTYQMGYDHLTHGANTTTPCEHNILEVAVRGNERFSRVQSFGLAFRIHGIVKGNLIEGNIDRTKVHTKGTLEFSNAVRTELLARADIEKNPYLVVEYNFVKEEIYVKYVNSFYIAEVKSQDDKIIYILGSFINKRGPSGQPDITYFEFNQQII